MQKINGRLFLEPEELEQIKTLEGMLVDFETELARAREAGLETDLALDEKQQRATEMRRKIKGMKRVYGQQNS